MASLRRSGSKVIRCAFALAAGLLAGCTTGVGEGHVSGVVSAPSCGLDPANPFDLTPSFFTAEGFQRNLSLRIQHGGDDIDYSDVLYVTVIDADDVARNQIGVGLDVGDQLDSPIRMSLMLNETCDFHDRTSVPVSYQSVSGTITFSAIYAPDVSASRLIEATFVNVRFEDPADPSTRYAVVSGDFSFLYSRGRPAQVFP